MEFFRYYDRRNTKFGFTFSLEVFTDNTAVIIIIIIFIIIIVVFTSALTDFFSLNNEWQ